MTIEEREKALIDISYMDEEEDASGQDGPLRTRNEVQKVVVQRPTITIKPEANIVEIGSVYAIVGDTVVVQGNVAGNEQVLDSGSLFVFGDREILGEVYWISFLATRILYQLWKLTQIDCRSLKPLDQ
jgi:H/ACA ribonucleoprotein complex non-core subunit NAF1